MIAMAQIDYVMGVPDIEAICLQPIFLHSSHSNLGSRIDHIPALLGCLTVYGIFEQYKYYYQ